MVRLLLMLLMLQLLLLLLLLHLLLLLLLPCAQGRDFIARLLTHSVDLACVTSLRLVLDLRDVLGVLLPDFAKPHGGVFLRLTKLHGSVALRVGLALDEVASLLQLLLCTFLRTLCNTIPFHE